MSNVVDISTQLQRKQYLNEVKRGVADMVTILKEIVDFFAGYELQVLHDILQIPTSNVCFNHLGFDFAYDKQSLRLDFFNNLVKPKEIFLTLETKLDVDIPVLGRSCEPVIRQWLQVYLDQHGHETIFSFELVAMIIVRLYSSSNLTIVEMTDNKLSVIQGTTNNRSLNYITINLDALVSEAKVLTEIINAPQEEIN